MTPNTTTIRPTRKRLTLALAACLAAFAAPAAFAANDGALVGRVTGENGAPVANATVTVRNPATGLERSVGTNADGEYRFPFLPVGSYTLSVDGPGDDDARIDDVRVALGAATNLPVVVGTATLATVEVTGQRLPQIDVSSVESATNFTAREVERLPVLRDASAVALLTPGVNKGDPDLGGISFGGSSIAENTVYINGLNVTDFYNRVGFSTVPFAFFQEFQVKTGGYSVEFGRTTGGVINAVTKSGTNDFHVGAELVWEPAFLQTAGTDFFNAPSTPGGVPTGRRIASFDQYDRLNLNGWASGALMRDRLFFFALYEARDLDTETTSSSGNRFNLGGSGDGFWGAKLDWQLNDSNLIELLAFSDANTTVTRELLFNLGTGTRGAQTDVRLSENGGDNHALTWTSYLAEGFSAKFMVGGNERQARSSAQTAVDCDRIIDSRTGQGGRTLGCTSAGAQFARVDDREATRADFEWSLGDHLLRFGLDREVNTSDHVQFYPGPSRSFFQIFSVTPGSVLNGVPVPAGVTAYVRTRELSVAGTFETINQAWYLEDNWQLNDTMVLNLGLRNEAFDNKDSEGRSYIKIDDMWAPRIGFAWDVGGDGRSKFFANAGRYFLPVANVINIKQAGAFLDRRNFFVFNGLTPFTYNGNTFQRPVLGARLGPEDTSQGNGTVGDLRNRVDADMDPVFQDELIVGWQAEINGDWSWGARAIYRRLTNAIDDLRISATPQCGTRGAPGFVMGNPGEVLTLWGDSNCDGTNDAFIEIDTSVAGWALFDDNGVFIGQRGWDKPRRTYKALELVLDRAWDDRWSFNAAYTLSFSEGNAEGPVNSDTNFADAGRTEAFDNPYVNLNAFGPLPNDRRHQFKFRGAYRFSPHWELGGTLSAISGRPISGLGVAAPGDDTQFYSFYTCVSMCMARVPIDPANPSGPSRRVLPSERRYELNPRGAFGRTPWLYDLGLSLAWTPELARGDLRVELAVFNVLNAEEVTQVDERREPVLGSRNAEFGFPTGWQSPRFGQLTVTLGF